MWSLKITTYVFSIIICSVQRRKHRLAPLYMYSTGKWSAYIFVKRSISFKPKFTFLTGHILVWSLPFLTFLGCVYRHLHRYSSYLDLNLNPLLCVLFTSDGHMVSLSLCTHSEKSSSHDLARLLGFPAAPCIWWIYGIVQNIITGRYWPSWVSSGSISFVNTRCILP